MPDSRELMKIIKRAFEERNTRDIGKKELLEWLKGNGLTPEQVREAIHLAIEQSIIRFCYPPSVGGELVPSYERITKEDLLPPEITEEVRNSFIQRERRAMRIKKRQDE